MEFNFLNFWFLKFKEFLKVWIFCSHLTMGMIQIWGIGRSAIIESMRSEGGRHHWEGAIHFTENRSAVLWAYYICTWDLELVEKPRNLLGTSDLGYIRFFNDCWAYLKVNQKTNTRTFVFWEEGRIGKAKVCGMQMSQIPMLWSLTTIIWAT